MDISTMLEEAVQYVKFLQLQIKVATQEAFNFQLNAKKKGQYYTYAKTITDNFLPYMNLTASKLWWFVDVLSDCLQWNEHWTGTWYYPSKRNKGYAIAIKENAMQQIKRDWFYFVIFFAVFCLFGIQSFVFLDRKWQLFLSKYEIDYKVNLLLLNYEISMWVDFKTTPSNLLLKLKK